VVSAKPVVRPAVDSARRLVLHPVDLGYLRRGDGPGASATVPPVFALGRESAVLLMRFSVALPSTVNVVEAYVVLHRAGVVDDDPAPVLLHATRIVEAWDSRSISWAVQPRTQDGKWPATVVEPSGPSLVRIDVRDLVRQWPRRDPSDRGIAVIAENETPTGTSFASVPGSGAAPEVEPYMELYLR